MYDGPIIDSHHHIWEWQNYPWLAAPMTPKMFADDYSALRQDYLVEHLIADFGDHNGLASIMHAVAIKRSTAKEHPWLAQAVFEAYSNSKRQNYADMAQKTWLYGSLPWFAQEFDETRALMGDNYYSYGIGPNRKTLEALFRYSYQQGLASRELTIEEMFLPASLEFAEADGR